jgi:ubiquinone/menaquinone biosynthesis C-methylase UbiE
MTLDWKMIWDKKGSSSADRIELSGFEKCRDFDTVGATNHLIELMHISRSDSVLEIGCGAGLLGQHLKDYCRYVGSDRSQTVISRSIELNGFQAICCEANDIIFKDGSFDHVFAFSVFQYFPTHTYARTVLDEMFRVARKCVCVSDVPEVSPEPNHLLYAKDFFAGWSLSGPFYKQESLRFTACYPKNRSEPDPPGGV